ncbi:MAG: hypothetical protein ACRDVE_12860 [Actinocrinis sp.]
MAVHIDIDALLESLPADVRSQALDASTRLRSLRSSDGGARAAVITADAGVVACWIGVVDGALAADCECRADRHRHQSLCAHAVVVAQAAVEADLPWSANATTPGSALPEPAAEWVRVAESLTRRELVGLVADQAVHSRSFASSLLKAADLLGPPGPAEIALVRKAIDEALSVESGYEWDLHDIAVSGYRLAEELELLAERPATGEALEIAEDAIEAWDGHLYGILSQNYHTYETEPDEIGGRIAAAHLAICASLRPDPEQLAADLVRLEGLAEIESSVDALGAYRHLLGPTGVAAYKDGIKQLRRTRGR